MVSEQLKTTPLATGSGAAASRGEPHGEAQRARYLIVVSRDQPDLWRHLQQLLTGADGFEVVLDRRHGGRWQWSQSVGFQERGADRRRAHDPRADFVHRSFIIVDPKRSEKSASFA